MHEITDEQRALYLRELLRRYGTLSLPLGSGLNFSLIQVFQPLRLRQSATEMQRHSANEHDKDQQDEREESEEKNEAELVENGIEALKKSPRGRLVILGSPGSGKTTVLKHLLSHHAHIALEESTAPLPIFLSLPDLARAGRDLDAYLAFIASDMGLDANDRHVLSHAIQQGHAFVCLDSLDEVLPGLRAGIIRQINELAQRSGNGWIVGSRFTEYKGGQFQQGQFQEWELQALDEPRRVQLAAQLLPEFYQSKGRTFSVDDLRATLKRFNTEQQAFWNVEETLSRVLNAGLLDVVAYETYSFRHQTFQEYLAALALAQRFMSENAATSKAAHEFARSKRMHSRWSEILHLLVSILAQEYGQTGREGAQSWLAALATAHKQPEGDVGHLDLILALRSLPELPLSEQENELADVASELVVHWAEILIATARATRESYYEDPRLTRLRQLARDVRLLSQPIVQAGVERLTSVFLDPGEYEQVRGHIIHTVGDLGEHAPLQALFSCLREYPIPILGELERALQAVTNHVSLEPVIMAVLDPNEHWKVREQAALLLGRSGKPEAVSALVTVAREDDSLACHAIDALALLGKDAPLDVLIDILRNDHSQSGWKRVHAARALGELGQESASEALIEVLSSAQAQADAEIVEALITLQASFPFEQLVAWLTSPKWHLQWLAIEKLTLFDQPVPARPLLAILRRRVKHDDYDQHRLRASALRLLNKQASLVPLHDLRRLLKENHWSLQDKLRHAFCLHGAAAPLDASHETLASESHERAMRALQTLEMLQQDVSVEHLLAHYAHGVSGIDSRHAEWGRALLQYGTRLPAETLITIACECAGFREDNEDEDMVAALGRLGEYIVDALLTKLPAYSVIDFDFLPKVAHAVYEAIPEEKLLATLQRSEGDIYTAAGILAVTGEDQYIPLLRSVLDKLTEHPVAYCKILSALAKFRGRFPLDILLTALQQEHAGIRETAVHILRELSAVLDVSQLVAPLQASIIASQDDPERDDSSRSAGDLVEALGLCREYAPIAFLVTLLEDEGLSDEAGEALATLGHYVPFEVFFTMLHSPKGFLDEHALLGLGKQKEHVPVERLLTLFPWKGDAPERSEHEQGEESHEEDEDEQYLARLAVNALLELEEYASIDVLKGFLQHEDERVRAGAQRALAELATKGLQDRVIRPWLNRYDEHLVRQSVVETHAALGEGAPLAFWIGALQGDENEALAVGAACVLERLARVIPATIATLAPACNLPGMRLARLRAWSMLGQIDEVIMAARSDTQNEVRQRAIEILGELRDPVAIEPLAQLLRDEDDSRLLLAIVDALSTLGNVVLPEPLLESCGYRTYESRNWCSFDREPGVEAAAALKQTHPDVFRTLVPLAEAMVRGEAPTGVFASRTRSRIADAMKGIGRAGPAALANLTESLDWPYWQVRMKAAQALGKLRRNIPDAAIRRLLELRHDPHSRAVREAADEALAEILSLEAGIEDD